MRIFTFLVLLIGVLITSCNSPKAGADYDKSIMPAGYDPNAKVEAVVENKNQEPANSNNSNIALNPNSGMSNNSAMQGQQMPVTQNSNNPSNKSSNSTVAKGLNPAHGQPGHRCDIPEGSPLSSAPTATTNAPQTITTTSNSPAKTVTAAGMNPAHGEPGHRCDIAVGAPLNSPVQQAPTPTKTIEQ